MNEELKGSGGSQPMGSPNPVDNGPANAGEPDYRQMYEELEKKLGEQGKELGDHRKFVESITPILDKLDVNPDLIQAILQDKIDDSLAKAIISGQVKIEDAQTVSQAHQEIKKELGKKYDSMPSEEVEKKIEERAKDLRQEFRKELEEVEELRGFEKGTIDFINSKPDFAQYADEISAWLDTHEDQDDIEVAYDVVKKRHLEKLINDGKNNETGALNKDVALNAGGGSSNTTAMPHKKDIFGELVETRKNPNEF